MNGEQSGDPVPWSRPQNVIAYREARAMLDAQQTRKQHFDDAALRTSRLTTVVVGVFASLVVGIDPMVRPVLAGAGGVALLGAFGTSLAAHNFAQLYLGPGEEYLGEFLDLPDSDWEQDLLGAMGEWVDGNEQTLKTTSELLVVAEALLFAGTALAAGGIVL